MTDSNASASRTPGPERATQCIAVMMGVANRAGWAVKPNARGNLACSYGGKYRGEIIVIRSQFDIGSLCPIASRGQHELNTLRDAMCDALLEAGLLTPAQSPDALIDPATAIVNDERLNSTHDELIAALRGLVNHDKAMIGSGIMREFVELERASAALKHAEEA